MLPNSFILGVQKSGTTYLAELLRQHPDIYFPRHKELHYFSNPRNLKKGLASYERNFAAHSGEKYIMEATPGYITKETTIKSIHETLGDDVKLIVIMREPISRMISQYKMRYTVMHERRPLNKAISECLDYEGEKYTNYVRRSMYYDQIKMIEKYYPRDMVHLVVFENFIADPGAGLKEIMDFLEIEDNFEFNLDSSRNTGNPSRVNLFGLVFYRMPFTFRRNIIKLMPKRIRKRFNEMVLNKKKPLEMEDLSDENLRRVSGIFEEQMALLKDEYKLDLRKWEGPCRKDITDEGQ